MKKTNEIERINKELKILINEASFISMKCRNKLLRIFGETFLVDLDISNYKNVDLSVGEDLNILYREDKYEIDKEIGTIEEFVERYDEFKIKADQLINKKNINFDSKRNYNNIINLIVVLGLIIFVVAVIYFCIKAFIRGDYYNLLWFLVFIVPAFVPNLKESLQTRIVQAKNYIKSLFKKK